MPIKEKIENLIRDVIEKQGVPKDAVQIKLDHPADPAFGDYSTNVAMLLSKSLGVGKNPLAMAEKIAEQLNAEISHSKHSPVSMVKAAAPGFVNFYLSKEFFAETVADVLDKAAWYGKNTKMWNKKIIIEHTNLNPYKPVHIGHLVNNSIGESLSRILEFQDAKITRATYGGDVGLHVAKALWGMLRLIADFPREGDLKTKIDFIGKAYVLGSEMYDDDEQAKKEIQDINKQTYKRSDTAVDELYIWGKKASIDYFAAISQKLGSHFDYQFFESEVADDGLKFVQTGLERGVFEKSDGAIIFPGEKYGLHNRVFITSQGLPTYEAKELGLTKKKFEIHDFNYSLVITASEQNDYFRVILKAIGLIFPEIASRTIHLSHGMMRFASGKMSSRKGNVITAESFISDVEDAVGEKIHETELSVQEKSEITEKVAIAAIKYSILRQSIGKDIIFDTEKSVSLEGDSGPYLQYAYVRAKSILAKARQEGIMSNPKISKDHEPAEFEKKLYEFPEIIERAAHDYAPNYIATYLTELAGAFNSYYAVHKIVDKKDPDSPYKVALTEALSIILKNGLYLLGIQAPDKM
jgi:arginyl-tRNA synthetase